MTTSETPQGVSENPYEGMVECKMPEFYYFPIREVNYPVQEIERLLSQSSLSDSEKERMVCQLLSKA